MPILYSISYLILNTNLQYLVAKTVKVENQALYEIHFSSLSKKIFDIRPDIELQRRVNLYIWPDITVFFFNIEKHYSISKVYDDISNKTSISGTLSGTM